MPGGRWDANNEPRITDDTNNPSEETSEYPREKNGHPSGSRRPRYNSTLNSGPAAAIQIQKRDIGELLHSSECMVDITRQDKPVETLLSLDVARTVLSDSRSRYSSEH